MNSPIAICNNRYSRAPPRRADPVAGARTARGSNARTPAKAIPTPRASAPSASCCQINTPATVGTPPHRKPQQEADADADVDPKRPGAAGRRRRLRCAALLQRPEVYPSARASAAARGCRTPSCAVSMRSARICCSGDVHKNSSELSHSLPPTLRQPAPPPSGRQWPPAAGTCLSCGTQHNKKGRTPRPRVLERAICRFVKPGATASNRPYMGDLRQWQVEFCPYARARRGAST